MANEYILVSCIISILSRIGGRVGIDVELELTPGDSHFEPKLSLLPHAFSAPLAHSATAPSMFLPYTGK